MYAWKAPYQSGIPVQGPGHGHHVSDAVIGVDVMHSIGMDDRLRSMTLANLTYDAA